MILPTSAGISNYGGAKQDYAPSEDPSTDELAADRNNLVDDVAGMTHTACRAWRCFVGGSGGSPADPADGNTHDAVWGNASSVKPTVTRSSTGVYVVTWPTSISDALGTSHTIAIRRVLHVAIESATAFVGTAVITAANVITVHTFSSTTANDASGANITVYWV